MEDLERQLDDFASEFFGSRAWEPAVRELFASHTAGKWVPTREICSVVEDCPLPQQSVWATWLANPAGRNRDYVIVILSEPDSGWTNTAVYNAARLLNRSPQYLAVA